ncbi:DUF4038 domain-containing protein [Paenibacillus thalictri]|uniref:DUF4038 domain-containing protein n=1 Tax=Paenibacillus thalictri TaxID=2527873 RepID=A0A4Q9DEU2_9BACL|nr:DUF4038 domain-containing protein [Paenibacillus thalictri]TBL70320.1 DUF4038 domain-containing protein [Paenibacillus thalictri]
MSRVTVNASRDGFVRNNKPFFYFADTVWSVFSNASLEEWEEYLTYRSLQNFNVVQISVLPVLHDASDTYTGSYPFELRQDGSWDFYNVNPSFFDKAEKMVQMAYEKGFVPALVVLWNNFVPGTWANVRVPEYTMPLDAVKPYTEYVAKRFGKYDPIYFISGDTRFENDEIIEYFQVCLHALKAAAPEALTALHVTSHFHNLPESFVHSDELDLYIYQSGHHLETQYDTYRTAEQFLRKPVRRPIINTEPPYEGHGHGNLYGRFNAFDIRKAFWQSVLAGAKAGFTYGAHGVWSWHKLGAEFTSENWSKVPFVWRNALKLPGAWDASYSRWLFEKYELYDIEPANELLVTGYEDIRMATSSASNRFVIYASYSNDIKVKWDGADYEVTMIDLASRNVLKPQIRCSDEFLVIPMNECNSDSLIIAERRS